MPEHPVVSREQWLEARKALMQEEKAFTRQRDALSAARRALPWVQVDRDYRFVTEDGECGLSDLFAGLSQLCVYHFMFEDDWEAGCKSCSFWADNYNGIIDHLRARDVSFVAVSKAPLEKLLAYRARLGWQFPWVQSPGNAFGRDFGVSFTPDEVASGDRLYNFGTLPAYMTESPGMSTFIRDGDAIYHTYSVFARGLDMLNTAYHHLDLMPKGRDEDALPYPMDWVRIRDEYPFNQSG